MRHLSLIVFAVCCLASPAFAQEGEPAADANLPPAPPPIEEKPAASVGVSKPEHAPTLENFRQALGPYGRWVQTAEYGWVWIPNVDPTWRPYTNGQWAYTEYGWTFASFDPWGWGPFHYGRWYYYNPYGWAWIPGYEWAPAWVTWRYGAGVIGWAPLGPYGVGLGYYGYPSVWSFVGGRYFHRPLVRRHFVPTRRVGGLLRTTYFAGAPRRGRYFSPPAGYVSRLSGRRVVQVSARRIAPSWVARTSAYRPRAEIRNAYRGGRAVRPYGRGASGARTSMGYRGYSPGYRDYPGYRGYRPGYPAHSGPGYRRYSPSYRGPAPAYRGHPGPSFRGSAPSTRSFVAPSRSFGGGYRPSAPSGGRRR